MCLNSASECMLVVEFSEWLKLDNECSFVECLNLVSECMICS